MAVNRIPAIYPFREYAEAGGLIAYGSSISSYSNGQLTTFVESWTAKIPAIFRFNKRQSLKSSSI